MEGSGLSEEERYLLAELWRHAELAEKYKHNEPERLYHWRRCREYWKLTKRHPQYGQIKARLALFGLISLNLFEKWDSEE